MLYRAGALLRESGQALDRLGSVLQGSYAFREQRRFFGGIQLGRALRAALPTTRPNIRPCATPRLQ